MSTRSYFLRHLSLAVFLGILCAIPVAGEEAQEQAIAPVMSVKRFTIQTGTFESYGQSLRQFMRLARILDSHLLEDMRIERLEKYYVVRVSSHDRIEETYRKLTDIRETVSDAFAMNESPETDARTVYLYPDVSATSSAYTLEAGRYPERDQAQGRFDGLKPDLQEDLAARLRLEKEGAFFLVTLGPFDNYVMARRIQRMLRDRDAGQTLLRERTPGEGTELLTSEEARKNDTVSNSVTSTQPASSPPPVEPFEAEEIVKPLESLDETMNGFLDEKEYGKAMEVIRQAIERWPDNPDLYAWYGTVLMEMERPDKALEHYQKAAELAPAVPEYQSNLGYSYLHIQRSSARQSIDAFNRALTLDPDNADALEGLGTVYVSIGRKDLAVGIHEELKLLDPDAARRLQDFIRYGIDIGQ